MEDYVVPICYLLVQLAILGDIYESKKRLENIEVDNSSTDGLDNILNVHRDDNNY